MMRITKTGSIYTLLPRTVFAALVLLQLSGCVTLDSFFGKSPDKAESTETAESVTSLTSVASQPDEPSDETVHADIFHRIRKGFAIPDIEDELVLNHQKNYLGRPDNLRRLFERGRPYLHHIVEEIEKRKMPLELALLPMVESAYDPMAYSRSKASGLWQFIPSTGRYFKLEQSWWRDERRDILASTSAALDLVEMLYERHGDWHLALASYNWGGSAVGKAVAQNREQGLPTDYLSLNSMPDETRNYVPRLQALKNIVRDPELFAALEIPAIPNRPYFAATAPLPSIDVKLAARFAELSEQELLALNPAHNRPVIVSKSPLLLPEDRVEIFAKNIQDYLDAGKPLSSWQLYTLRQEEKLDEIAKRFGMTLTGLMQANDIDRDFEPRPGLSLLVASNEKGKKTGKDGKSGKSGKGEKTGEPLDDKTLSRSLQFPESERNGYNSFITGGFYTIRKGDTLPLIARRAGVSVKELQRHNKLRGDLIFAGKQLAIPRASYNKNPNKTPNSKTSYNPPPAAKNLPDVRKSASSAPVTANPPLTRATSYTIRPGDTLSSIAKQFRVAVDDLMRWNQVSPTKLQPGKTLRILLARTP